MSVFSFGKHKGKSIDMVLSLDPAWIVWCYKNVTTIAHGITKEQYKSAQNVVKARKEFHTPIKRSYTPTYHRQAAPQRQQHKSAFEMLQDYERAYRATHRMSDGKLIGSEW